MARSRVVPGRFITLDRVALGFAAVVIVLAASSTESAEGTTARSSVRGRTSPVPNSARPTP